MWNDRRILPVFGPSKSGSFLNVNIRSAPISVPDMVKLYLRPFEDGSYLLRVHNMDSQSKVSYLVIQKTVSIDAGWTLTELTLAANQLLKDWKEKQLSWNEEKNSQGRILDKAEEIFEDIAENIGEKFRSEVNLVANAESDTSIELRQFEIRTFRLTKM